MPINNSKTVLIIEDSCMIRLQAKHILETNGFTTLELDNAEDYFSMPWQYKDVGLILLDINLPSISGVDVLKRMNDKKSKTWPPVVMISAISDPRIITDTIKLGAKDYVVKPFDDNDLLQRVVSHYSNKNKLNKVSKNQTSMPKQLWGIVFTADSTSMGTGVAVIDNGSVAGGTSAYYFIGQCDITSNPASARIVVNKFAPGRSALGATLNNYTLILSGTLAKDEISLTGYIEESPEKKVTARMRKLSDF